jgi:hypothetical protein
MMMMPQARDGSQRQRERGLGIVLLGGALVGLGATVNVAHNGDPGRPGLSNVFLVAALPFLVAGIIVLIRGANDPGDVIGGFFSGLFFGLVFPGGLVTMPLSFLPTVPLLLVVAALIPIGLRINEAIARRAAPPPEPS